MSRRTVFFGTLVMLFLGTMTVGMTLIFKEKTEEALQVFGGATGLAAFLLILWAVVFDD